VALWLRLVAPVLCHPLFLFLFFVVFPKQPMLPPTSEIFCQIRLEEIFLLLVVIRGRSATGAGNNGEKVADQSKKYHVQLHMYSLTS